jgi:hypothetical protein
MDTLAITLRTRTPIWTGGIDGTTDRLHTTGDHWQPALVV